MECVPHANAVDRIWRIDHLQRKRQIFTTRSIEARCILKMRYFRLAEVLGDHTDQKHATSTRPDVDKLRRFFHPFKCQFEECEWHLTAMNCTISYTRNTSVTLCGDIKKKLYIWSGKTKTIGAKRRKHSYIFEKLCCHLIGFCRLP